MYRRKRSSFGRYRGSRFESRSGIFKIILAVLAVLLALWLIFTGLSNLGSFMEIFKGDASGRENEQQLQPPQKPADGSSAPQTPPAENTSAVVPSEPVAEPPAAAYAVYVTDGSAYTEKGRQGVLSDLSAHGANAVVIDVKDGSGKLSYISSVDAPFLDKVNGKGDLAAAVQEFKDNDVYVIARLSCFYDDIAPRRYNKMAVKTSGVTWLDRNYHSWINPYSPEGWDYISSIAQELCGMGVDEIMLRDYVFPTLGKVNIAYFSENDTIEKRAAAITTFVEKIKHDIGSGKALSLEVGSELLAGDGDGKNGIDLTQLSAQCDMLCPVLRTSVYSKNAVIDGNKISVKNDGFTVLASSAADYLRQKAGDGIPIRPWLDINAGSTDSESQIITTDSLGCFGCIMTLTGGR